MTENLPNFLIVGTAKAATTTIHEYLKQHPDIFMTEWKEPCFFVFKDKTNIRYSTDRPVKFVTKENDYKDLFEEGKSKEIRGESSTPYLYLYEDTIKNIKKTVANYRSIKILIVLRNPIERAFSQYMMKVRDLVEEMSFLDAIKHEKKRMEENAHFDFFYVDRGLYFNQVKSYLDEFDHVKILLYDEFRENDEKTLNEIVAFLGLRKIKFRKIGKQNISGRPKIKVVSSLLKDNLLKRFLSRIIPKNIKIEIKSYILDKNLKKERIDKESKQFLIDYYRNDIVKLEKLINRDLSDWLK